MLEINLLNFKTLSLVGIKIEILFFSIFFFNTENKKDL